MQEEVIKLKIPSKPQYIRKTRKVIEEICGRSGFTKRQIKELKLALSEALANVIEHAYKNNPDQTIFIYFVIGSDKMEVVIRDFGKKPDPDKFKTRDLSLLKERGLGLFFMEKFVDHLMFDFSGTRHNELKFIKYKEAGAEISF